MALRDYKGNARPTTLSAGINATDLSFDIDDDTGWPVGGANGKFFVTFDPDGPLEETVLVSSQAAGTCTIASLADRGVDDTSAAGHTAGTVVIHSFSATDAREANRHINNTTDDNHTQYMRADGTRHDLTARHSAGSVVPTAAPVAATVGASNAEGGGTTLARAAHVHGFATGTPSSVGTANAQGASSSFPRLDHVHDIGNGAIDAAALFGAGVVDSNALAAASVIAGKVAAGGISATNQLTDAIVTLAKFASEASTSYTPATFCSGGTFSLGTGGTKYGHYFKLGRIVVGWTGFDMAADGNLVGTLDIPIPIAMRTTADGQRGFAAGRAKAGSQRWSGTGVITSGSSLIPNLATAGASTEWDTTNPFNWGTGGVGSCELDVIFFYEAAT